MRKAILFMVSVEVLMLVTAGIAFAVEKIGINRSGRLTGTDARGFLPRI